MTARPKSFAEAFLTYFDVSYATNQAQILEAGRIRYRVYCEEFAYECADEFPDGIEQDEFDADSLHCLVTHKATGLPAGCVRLVKPPENCTSLMPFEKHCSGTLDESFFSSHALPRNTICEISRLAVDSKFRRRSGERANRFGDSGVVDLSQHEQRTFPMIAVSCFLAATALAKITGHVNAFAMMEPFLPRLLTRSGIIFTRVGQDIDYHGLRAPYFANHQATMKTIVPELKELYDEIHRVVKHDLDSD